MVGRSLARQFGKALFGIGEQTLQTPRGSEEQALPAAPLAATLPGYRSLSEPACIPDSEAEPACSPEAAVEDRERPGDDPDGPRPVRILAAEDNPTNRQVLELILGMIDAEVTFGVNGAEAVELFSQAAWDVVLMDVQMPVMDGLQATRAIRALERADRRDPTPIIAVTANAMPHHVDECLRAGMDAHVPKPVNAAALFTRIAELTAGQPEQTAAAA